MINNDQLKKLISTNNTHLQIVNILFAFRSAAGVHFFYALTLLASPIVSVVAMVLLAAALGWRRRWRTGMIGLVGFFSAAAVTSALKILLHRPRPDILLRAITENSYSLPSGHATMAAFVFGFLGYFIFLQSRSKPIRVLTMTLVVFGVLMIDFSRLYLGVHYVSDVLAGNAVGFLALFVCIFIDQWWQKRNHE